MSAITPPSTVTLEMEGVLTTSLVAKVALPYAGRITAAFANVSTAPTGAALNFTLVKGAVNAGHSPLLLVQKMTKQHSLQQTAHLLRATSLLSLFSKSVVPTQARTSRFRSQLLAFQMQHQRLHT